MSTCSHLPTRIRLSATRADRCSLTPKPLLLFYHFFSVAFYSIYILLTQGMPPKPGSKAVVPSWAEVPGLLLFSVRVVSVIGATIWFR